MQAQTLKQEALESRDQSMVFVWSRPAREDLRLIHQYIAHDSRHYATRY